LDSRQPSVYILASRARGTLYIGVTSSLAVRIWQHKTGCVEGFTKRYRIDLLVWYEIHGTMADAIEREKRLKEWKRAWKIELIESVNPGWVDRFTEIL
jgi:putative endonuclease